MRFDDEKDKRLLSALQKDARISGKEAAISSGHSEPACSRRFKLLKESGIIKRYTVEIDHSFFGFNCLTFMHIKLHRQDSESSKEVSDFLHKHDNIIEIHKTFGEWDFLIKARCRTNEEIQNLVDIITSNELIQKISSEIVSQTILEEISIPVDTLFNSNEDKN